MPVLNWNDHESKEAMTDFFATLHEILKESSDKKRNENAAKHAAARPKPLDIYEAFGLQRPAPSPAAPTPTPATATTVAATTTASTATKEWLEHRKFAQKVECSLKHSDKRSAEADFEKEKIVGTNIKKSAGDSMSHKGDWEKEKVDGTNSEKGAINIPTKDLKLVENPPESDGKSVGDRMSQMALFARDRTSFTQNPPSDTDRKAYLDWLGRASQATVTEMVRTTPDNVFESHIQEYFLKGLIDSADSVNAHLYFELFFETSLYGLGYADIVVTVERPSDPQFRDLIIVELKLSKHTNEVFFAKKLVSTTSFRRQEREL